MKLSNIIALFVSFVFVLILIFVTPFIQIWAVNTVFCTNIEYSWLNWIAVLILNASIKNISFERKK